MRPLIGAKLPVRVLSQQLARDASEPVPYIVISITGVGDNPATLVEHPNRVAVLRLQFDDVLAGEKNEFAEEQAQQVVAFMHKHEGKYERLIIHCFAGMSRSAGIGAAVGKWKDNDDIMFFKLFTPSYNVYIKTLQAFHDFAQASSSGDSVSPD